MSKIFIAAAIGASIAASILLNPSEQSFRDQIDKDQSKQNGFVAGKVAKFTAFIMQQTEQITYRNFVVFSTITDETQPQGVQLIAVGAFGKWFYNTK